MRLLALSGLVACAGCALMPAIPRQVATPHTLSPARHARTRCKYVEGMSDLEEDAAALLEEADGDIDKARTSYIGYTLAYLEDAMPELYSALKTDPKRPDAHAAV